MSKKENPKYEKELKEQIKIQRQLLGEAREFRRQFAGRTLKLVTSGFGLVSALAWNELIKEIIKVYIQPLFGETSGIISLLIYALIVTALAVFITFQVGKIAEDKEK